jgi:hypothetical protein
MRQKYFLKQPKTEPKLTLVNGNIKVGNIFDYSLPHEATCPGMSPLCSKWCYVRNRNYSPSVQRVFAENLAATKLPTFKGILYGLLMETQLQWKKGQTKIFRFHPSGDFYSEKYVRDWIEIVQKLPDWQFYGYTRSWAVESLEPSLLELAGQPNVCLYASMDRTMEDTPADWKLQSWISYEQPPDGFTRCKQEVALKVNALKIWKRDGGKGYPGREVLRRIALLNQIQPLWCLDCGYCIEGKGNVWFKMRSPKSDLDKFLNT